MESTSVCHFHKYNQVFKTDFFPITLITQLSINILCTYDYINLNINVLQRIKMKQYKEKIVKKYLGANCNKHYDNGHS